MPLQASDREVEGCRGISSAESQCFMCLTVCMCKCKYVNMTVIKSVLRWWQPLLCNTQRRGAQRYYHHNTQITIQFMLSPQRSNSSGFLRHPVLSIGIWGHVWLCRFMKKCETYKQVWWTVEHEQNHIWSHYVSMCTVIDSEDWMPVQSLLMHDWFTRLLLKPL